MNITAASSKAMRLIYAGDHVSRAGNRYRSAILFTVTAPAHIDHGHAVRKPTRCISWRVSFVTPARRSQAATRGTCAVMVWRRASQMRAFCPRRRDNPRPRGIEGGG